MSQEQAWILEEMARSMQADRLAAAERYRLLSAGAGSSTSPRILLAKTLRSLATLLDGGDSAPAHHDRRLVRAY